MTSRQLETLLFRDLDARFAPLGFHRTRPDQPYSREVAGVRHTIGVGTREYLGNDLEALIGSASVRFNSVEDLIARFEEPHPLMTPEDIQTRQTWVVDVSALPPEPGDPLARWGGDAKKLWLIHSESEVRKCAPEMVTYAVEVCEPVFREFSDPRRVLGQLLTADHGRGVLARFAAEHAIALAYVLDGMDAARQIAKTRVPRLRGEHRTDLAAWVKRFIDTLSNESG